MPVATSNLLFSSLKSPARRQLTSICRRVDLPVNTMLYEAGQHPKEAYFLGSGFASQVIDLDDSGSAGVGLVGREGVVGSTALLGPAMLLGSCFMQAGGTGYAAPFPLLREVFSSSEEIRTCILQFVQCQTVTGAYLAACNKLHETEARLARWLLMVQDRLETDLLPLTQEFLAQMLGTRRMTITIAAGALQRSGLIEYSRGHIRILDRPELEGAACECYGHVKRAYDDLYVLSPHHLTN
jgi:CRP-like cAMP-binding protein